MSRLVVIGAVIALGVIAGTARATTPYTLKATTACLMKHRILVTPMSTNNPIAPELGVADFDFDGIPANVLDQGQLIFEKSAVAAASALKTLDTYWVNYDVTKRHMKRASVVAEFKLTQQVIGNVIVWWNNFPQTKAAKTLIHNCLH